MKMKTSELSGVALDWAVAKCEGLYPSLHPYGSRVMPNIPGSYSTDWRHGGPIIDREDIDVFGSSGQYRAALCLSSKHPQRNVRSRFPMDGPTKLTAAMRCYVTSKLGDEVDVPEKLL